MHWPTSRMRGRPVPGTVPRGRSFRRNLPQARVSRMVSGGVRRANSV